MADRLYVIKNTFIEVADDGGFSPPAVGRRRAHTTAVDWAGKGADSPRSTATSPERHASGCLAPSSPSESFDSHEACCFEFDSEHAHEFAQQLETATRAAALLVARSLHGRAVEAAGSQGHLILQSLIVALPTQEVAFIAEELAGEGARFAISPTGHEVICRLVEFSSSHPATVRLVDEVLALDMARLCGHKYGHRIAMSILSNGLEHQQAKVLDALCLQHRRLGRHRFGSLVLQRALAHADRAHGGLLVATLLEDAGDLSKVACNLFGLSVVRALLAVPSARDQAVAVLRPATKRLQGDRFAATLLSELCLVDSNTAPCIAPRTSAEMDGPPAMLAPLFP